MLKQLLISAALATVAISASAESKVLWQSEDPAGVLVDWGQAAFYLSPEDAAAQIKAGDTVTITVSSVTEGGWPQVCIFKDTKGGYGEPIIQNAGVGGKEYPFTASFSITPSIASTIAETGIAFGGNGAYVSAVGLEKSTIEVDPNAIWFGPKECNWGNAVSISKGEFSNVAPGDKIIVEYDKDKGHTLQFLFGGWGGANIPSYEAWKTNFLTNDEEAGTYIITLNSSLSDLTWEVEEGEEGNKVKVEKHYDLFSLLKEGGLIMHGPCTVNQVLYIPAPLEYPEEMSYTLNGKAELEGVTVTQEYSEGTLSFSVTGECDADEVIMEFATPQGWDSMIVMAELTGGDYEYAKKAPIENDEYSWYPLEFGEQQGFKPGNSFTFPVNGEEQYGMIQLVKDNQIYWATIDITFEVAKAKKIDPELAAANQAAYEAVIAQLDALQEKYDAAVAKIKETNPDFDFSEYEEIPTMIEQYRGWAAQALAAANEEGEEFMFPFDGEEIEAFISTMLMAADPAPEFPTSLDVTLSSNEGVELTVDDTQGIFIINVSGKSSEEEITITVAVPEGYDGFVSIRDIDMDLGIGNDPLLTRAEEPEWLPISYLLESGGKESNTMTFPVDGELHAGQFCICKNGFADVNNQINVEFEVESNATVGVSGVNAAENATFYDLQGNRIAKPAKGMYVKVADGKAMKVVVK